MFEKVRLVSCGECDRKHSKKNGGRDWVRVIVDVSPKKEGLFGVCCWRGSGQHHHILSVKQDREKSVIVCVDRRPQTLVLLSPGFWPKMGGTVTVRVLHLPEGTAKSDCTCVSRHQCSSINVNF
jgi:hypothetical protein